MTIKYYNCNKQALLYVEALICLKPLIGRSEKSDKSNTRVGHFSHSENIELGQFVIKQSLLKQALCLFSSLFIFQWPSCEARGRGQFSRSRVRGNEIIGEVLLIKVIHLSCAQSCPAWPQPQKCALGLSGA